MMTEVLMPERMLEHQRKGLEENEGSIAIGKYYFVFPKFPAECSYVRVVDKHLLTEIAYWVVDEWEEDGADVMGAIIGALCDGLNKS